MRYCSSCWCGRFRSVTSTSWLDAQRLDQRLERTGYSAPALAISALSAQATAASVTAPSSRRASGSNRLLWDQAGLHRHRKRARQLAAECCASISRQRSQPSTAGPSRRMTGPSGPWRSPEIMLRAGDHRREHILLGASRAVDLDDEVARDLVEHGSEQRLLGLEVMIDGALGDAGALRDLVHGGGGKALRPNSRRAAVRIASDVAARRSAFFAMGLV